MIRALRLAVLTILTMALTPVCQAHEGENAVLTGLKYVVVSLADLNPAIERDGLRKADLQKDVEQTLKAAGIDVLSVEDGEKKAAPLLYVETNVVATRFQCGTDQEDTVVFSALILVALKEPVTVLRTSTGEAVSTWSKHVIGATGEVVQIRNRVQNMLDEFVRAWRYSNTRR